jgi:hypothetical protein
MTLTKTTRLVTCGFVNRLDTAAMLSGSPGTIDGRAQAPSHWARLLLICSISLVFNLFVADMSHARPAKDPMNYKLHAYNQLLDWKQFECILKLYHKESTWNPKAVNGSHYGIPQGRSEWLKTASPYEQIEWGVRYIEHRYGTPCKAWQHFKAKGWH